MQGTPFAVGLLLLVYGCQAVRPEATEAALSRRTGGSRSPSPSRSKGKAPVGEGHSAGSGLLGDIVHQAMHRPTSPVHGSGRPAHGSGMLEDIVHQAMRRPTSAAHESQQTHPHTLHPSHATHSLAAAHQGHLSQAVHSRHGLSSHATSESSGTLDHVVAGLHGGSRKNHDQALKPKKQSSDIVKPKKPADVKPSTHGPQRPETRGSGKHPKGPWWLKPGGTPRGAAGTGKLYESQRKYREKKKLEKQGKQADGHPSGPHRQSPKGGGPGSPSAGSQAVSKRRLGGGIPGE